MALTRNNSDDISLAYLLRKSDGKVTEAKEELEGEIEGLRGEIPAPATETPLPDGTASVGTSARYAREDHVHALQNTDTHRPVKMNGTQILGSDTTTPLDLVAGSNMSLSGSGGAVTFAATDTTDLTQMTGTLPVGHGGTGAAAAAAALENLGGLPKVRIPGMNGISAVSYLTNALTAAGDSIPLGISMLYAGDSTVTSRCVVVCDKINASLGSAVSFSPYSLFNGLMLTLGEGGVWTASKNIFTDADTIPVANGGTGLSASPSLLVNLASAAAADVLQASPRPGVTGTLPVGSGGTGVTSLDDLLTALVGNLRVETFRIDANASRMISFSGIARGMLILLASAQAGRDIALYGVGSSGTVGITRIVSASGLTIQSPAANNLAITNQAGAMVYVVHLKYIV